MKNLPEDELFEVVENRLRNYGEFPDDDVWNRISGAIPSELESKWTIWTNRTAAALSLVVLFFLFYSENVASRNPPTISTSNIALGEYTKESIKSSKDSDPELTRYNELSQIDNQSRVKREDNSLNSSKVSNSITFVPEEIHPIQLAKGHGDVIKEERSTTGFVSNKVEEKIDEVLKTDSTLTAVNVLKTDSASAVGHVTPSSRRRKKSKLAFYAMISPSLSFQHVTPDSEDGVVVEKINSPGVISQERFGVSIETGFQGKIGERLQYLVGLSYYQQAQQITYEEKSDGSIIESGEDLNFEIKPAVTTHSFDYNMRNVGVHAGVLYTLNQRRLLHKAGLMLQYQMGLLQSSGSDVYDNSSSHYFNYQLVYRVEYEFPSGIGLFVQPGYTRSIIANEFLDAPFKMKQSRASIGVGVVYRF